MKRPLLAALLLGALAAVPNLDATASTSLIRDFSYGSEGLSLVQQGQQTTLNVKGSVRDFTPGRPDLPWRIETIEVPGDVRVVGVEVLSVETEMLADDVRIPATPVVEAGRLATERTAQDPTFYARSGFQPFELASLGSQGWQRGRNVAQLRVAPVRWDAASGRLERVSRLSVRLILDGKVKPAVTRLRVVPEWEGKVSGPPASGPTVTLERDAGLGPAPQPFKATQIPSLLGSPVAYVIITDDAMAGEFQRLADWKTQSGVPAVVRTMSFIRQQYQGGSDDAERIRQFIADAYSRWGTRWVLLGADTEILPTRYIVTTFYGGETIACDMYYSCLDGNWNDDGDSVFGEGYVSASAPGDSADFLPEVWVGRAPVTQVDQAALFVDKTLQYAKEPIGDYENRVLFFGEVLFPQNWTPGEFVDFDGAEMSEQVLPSLQVNPAIHYQRLYENHLDPRWEPGSIQETRQTVIDSLNTGTFNLAVHFGHGYRNVMSVGDANLTTDDVLNLTNGNRLFNLYANNCTSNAIDFPCIGEAFLLNPNGGAVTNIGSSRFDFPIAGRWFTEEYFRLVYEDSVTAVGEAQALQKVPFAALSPYNGVNRWTTTTLLLLGDPELRMFIGIPRELAVGHPSEISLGDSTIAVSVMIAGSPLEGARVTAYKPGDEYRSALTDDEGNVVLPFHPDDAGSFKLTVTAFDSRPYQTEINVTAAAVPLLADGPVQVFDDNLFGTIGDGNGRLDAGETVDVKIALTNNGGATASDVMGVLSTDDPFVTISAPQVSYGNLGPGASSTPVGAFRVSVPFDVPDQHEIAFELRVLDSGGNSAVEDVQVIVHAPELLHVSHAIVDVGGVPNGIAEVGETVTYQVRLRNIGTGDARAVWAKLRNHDGLATVTDSIASWVDLAPGDEALSDALEFTVSDINAKLDLRVSAGQGQRRLQFNESLVQTLDLIGPAAPVNVQGAGAASNIDLGWDQSSDPDLLGYNIYRATAESGPYNKINVLPTGRIAFYQDDGLSSLTRYYYQVSAVDSSGNESARSPIASSSTNPPLHNLFPVPVGQNTISSVAVDHLYAGYPLDIVAGANVVYVLHPDGSAPVDADGAGATYGDFTTFDGYYAAGPSIADLDDDGVKEVIAPNWTANQLYVFDQAGQVKPGWPVSLEEGGWSSAAIGDLDGNGTNEVVLSTNGSRLYAFRSDGSEWIDGDLNGATIGVFKTFAGLFNFGTPTLADLDGNSELDIIYGSFDKSLNAWRPDGSSLPGFPIMLPGRITASTAVGYLDGVGDTQLDIVVPTGELHSGSDSLYAFRADGSLRPGWPVPLVATGNNRTPSPALGDIDGDGFVDVVAAGTDGALYVYDRNGVIVPPFSGLRYSVFASGASESSPIVADLNGDGINDILIGDENGVLTAFSGTGAVLPGFPLQLLAEVKGTPAACDCDGDGLTEIVTVGYDTNIYMWDYNFPFSPAGDPPWPQFHHDAKRTGLLSNPAFVDVAQPPAAFERVEMARPWPNPTRGKARLWYGIPADRAGEPLELGIYDLSGRRIQVLERGQASAGRHSVEWNLRSGAGQPVRAGVYFLRMTIGDESQSQKVVVMK